MNNNSEIKLGDLLVRYLVDGSEGGGIGMFELEVPPGSMVPPPHSHTYNEECVYALEGILRYSVDGDTRDLQPGEWMLSPKGSAHAFSNPHNETAKALIVMTPDVGAQYFHDVAEVVNAAGPPDISKLLAVMDRYGLVPAKPPAA